MTYNQAMAKAKKIIDRHIQIARKGGLYENFGEKAYRKFKDNINTFENEDDLSFADKANVCEFLSSELSTIDQNS